MQTLWESITVVYNNIPQILPKKIVEVPVEVERIIVEDMAASFPRSFVRLAGVSGAVAVAMAAYGAHGLGDADPKMKQIYNYGNNFHLVHSVAVLASPLCRRPYLVGSLMTLGMLGFSGSCYLHALTGNTKVRYITPYGGMLLIVAWLAMLL